MVLIKCPECGKEISDRAASCPSCGCPTNQATTIEATGKRWKKARIKCILVMLVGGLIGIVGSMPKIEALGIISLFLGVLLIFGGFIGLIVVRTAVWWHHE
jgi:hypothetical protein